MACCQLRGKTISAGPPYDGCRPRSCNFNAMPGRQKNRADRDHRPQNKTKNLAVYIGRVRTTQDDAAIIWRIASFRRATAERADSQDMPAAQEVAKAASLAGSDFHGMETEL